MGALVENSCFCQEYRKVMKSLSGEAKFEPSRGERRKLKGRFKGKNGQGRIAAIQAGVWQIVPESYLRQSKHKELPTMQTWLTGELPDDWRLADVMPIYKKGWKEKQGKYRTVSLTSVPGKATEQIILSVIMRHMQNNQRIRPNHHGFKKAQSCLTNLISFYDKQSCLVDEGKAVDVVYLDFSKAFDTIFHTIFLEKLAAYGLDRKTGEPPLINGWIPYLGKALIFRKDAFKFLLDQQKKLGDIFTVHIAGRYITFIMDPFQYVYVIRNSKQLEFHEFANKMASKTFDYPALSKGKFPDLKENLHRIYQYLQGKPLDIISDHMMKNLQDIFEWKCSQATDWETEKMYKFCCSVMFEASFVTLYGRVPAADGHKVISEIRDKFIKFDASFPYLAANIPIELLGATKKVRKELIHHFLLKNMTKWLGGSKVVQARQDIFEKYELLGDYDKAAHHFAFLWASVGNTIPATFWAMYYLLRHPEALAAVRDEIDHLLQSTGQKRGPTYNIHLTREQLDNLVYLESALNESLRMCSSSMNIRISQEDFVLKLEGNQEVVLRKGDWIALYPQILHMDPEVYEDPKEYKFDRYIENGKKKTTFYKAGRKLKYFLMPFGSGISMCPGRFLAMNEMKMFLFILLSHFDVELAENKAVRLDNSRMGLGILLPDVDIAFRYKLRSLRN
ncbi:25-hydroxycholesterol 7-alpha-hydroxylase [Pitangus sulphuratus]|nr:25-hydroxycholesterol 7-alpha-hydroxylase [Pitangus sulphuratus]